MRIKYGNTITYYNNENIKRIKQFKNSKLNGKYIKWFNTGIMFLDCNYINDKLSSEYKRWHSNGQIEIQCCFKDGLFDGEYISYDENNKIYKHVIYKNSELMKSI